MDYVAVIPTIPSDGATSYSGANVGSILEVGSLVNMS